MLLASKCATVAVVTCVLQYHSQAVLYELFEEVVITEQLKREVLGKFLGEPPPHQAVVSLTVTAQLLYPCYLWFSAYGCTMVVM